MPKRKVTRFASLLTLVLVATASADTLIHDVRGYTPTNNGVVQFSVLVFDARGRVLATGGDDLLLHYPDAQRVAGEQRTLLPGLIDAHAHVYDLGVLTLNLDVTGSRSVGDAVAAIAAMVSEPFAPPDCQPHCARSAWMRPVR